jgi:phenylacetate-coenzyme A ligase PaaK-like adenylate-forming protein
LKPGEIYEVVITNFHGGAMVRYRIGDMIRITSARNNKLGIEIPQMTFERRSDDLIDLGGLVRLTERTIWQAIENLKVPYEDWVAVKETGEKPVVHLYLELKKDAGAQQPGLAAAIFNEIKKQDQRVNGDLIYDSLVSIVGGIPIDIHLLGSGAFEEYTRIQKAKGADLAHLKPPHINPDNNIVAILRDFKKTREEVRI